MSTAADSRRRSTWLAAIFLAVVAFGSIASLPWTLGRAPEETARRFEAMSPADSLQPPVVIGAAPVAWCGTDRLGRSMTVRLLLGGGISLAVGLAAAITALLIGTSWGLTAALAGGRIDNLMMRIVDTLYGLPSILLVVLLTVAMESIRTGSGTRAGGLLLDLSTLWLAIGAVSWLTLSRVVRGQVLSIRSRPFVESARVVGVPTSRLILRYYLPWLAGPIIACTALIVPMAMLSEAFLSFLGIGVQEPLPSWGNMAASALSELNPVRSRWWLLVWPCVLIAGTLVALTIVGESVRQALDPRSREPVT